MNTHELLVVGGLDPSCGLPYPGLRLLFGQVLLAGTVAALHQHRRVLVSDTTVTVMATEPTGCPAMDAVLAALGASSAEPHELTAVGRHLVGKVPISRLCGEAVARRGFVSVKHKRLLWVFSQTTLELKQPGQVKQVKQVKQHLWSPQSLTSPNEAVRAARVLAEQNPIRAAFEDATDDLQAWSGTLAAQPEWIQGVVLMLRSAIEQTRTGISPQT
jgi:hypothetical protein